MMTRGDVNGFQGSNPGVKSGHVARHKPLSGAGEELKIEEVEVAPPKAHEVRIHILHTGGRNKA